MSLAKIVMLLTLIGTLCRSKITIEVNEPDGFVEIEEAAIKLLATCFGDRDKTIVLLGEFPGEFVEKLSFNRSFSIVLLDDRERAENNYDNFEAIDNKRKHKVYVVVMMATYYVRSFHMGERYVYSQYHNSMASFLVLWWSPNMKFLDMNDLNDPLNIFYVANTKNMMNVNLMGRSRRKGVVVLTSNAFTKEAPKPWKFAKSIKNKRQTFPNFNVFSRKYEDNERMCRNLEFGKRRNVGKVAIPVVSSVSPIGVVPKAGLMPRYSEHRRKRLVSQKIIEPILGFIKRINGTVNYWYIRQHVMHPNVARSIVTSQTLLRAVNPATTVAYPHGTACKFLVTQFRGNKSQLRKLYEVIDGSSWIGMYIAYLITLIFFKFFLRQSVITGLLNLCRLTCNVGLLALPSNHSSRIYLGCLLFFVVTMQGIFSGNLASLLTHDFPVRQVNSFQDLVDYGYTVNVAKADLVYVNLPTFRGRLDYKVYRYFEDCIPIVRRDPLNACLCWAESVKIEALDLGLHVSDSCITTELNCHVIPWRWFLEEDFNKFIITKIESNTLLPFDSMVDERRLMESDAQEIVLGPEVMTLEDLAFAFAILGCGLCCATVTFVVELIVDLYCRKTSTNRIIFFN